MEGNFFKVGWIYEGLGQLIWVNSYGYVVFFNQVEFKGKFVIWDSIGEQLIFVDSFFVLIGVLFKKEEVVAILGIFENYIVFLLYDGKVFSFDGKVYDVVF